MHGGRLLTIVTVGCDANGFVFMGRAVSNGRAPAERADRDRNDSADFLVDRAFQTEGFSSLTFVFLGIRGTNVASLSGRMCIAFQAEMKFLLLQEVGIQCIYTYRVRISLHIDHIHTKGWVFAFVALFRFGLIAVQSVIFTHAALHAKQGGDETAVAVRCP